MFDFDVNKNFKHRLINNEKPGKSLSFLSYKITLFSEIK